MGIVARLDTANDEHIVWEYKPTFDAWLLGNLSRIDKEIAFSPQGDRIAVSLRLVVTNWALLIRIDNASKTQDLRYSYSNLSSIGVHGSWGAPLTLRFDDGLILEIVSTRPHLRGIELWEKISLLIIGVCGTQSDLQKAIDLVRAITISSLRQPDDFVPSLASTDKFYNYLRFSVNSSPSLDEAYMRNDLPQFFKSVDRTPAPLANFSGDSVRGSSRFMDVVFPEIHGTSYSGHISEWYIRQGSRLKKGYALFSILWCGNILQIRSKFDGIVERILVPVGGSVVSGQRVAVLRILPATVSNETSTDQNLSKSVNRSISHKQQSPSLSTASAIKSGRLNVVAGDIPTFQPSSASIPKGFESAGSHEADLSLCLASNAIDVQSFFNDLDIFGNQKSIFVNDDIVSIPCFDEGLYCNIVKQMHRYTLAEIADNKDQLAKDNAGLGAMVGSLVGLMTNNIFAPFLGHSLGKNLTDQTSKISEFLPDPHLLFYQDTNSYLSWSRAQVSSPKLRRLILDRQTKPDGTVFFRAIPAIVTADSVFPIQLFKCGNSTYFYRPFSAGIERSQVNYDATKIQKKYFHTRHMGESSKSDLMIAIRGNDVEPSEQNIYRFTGPSLDYFYVDFQIQPGFVF